MIKADTLLKNKPLIFLDKIIRYFGYCIVIICDSETRLVNKVFLDKTYGL